MSFKVHDVKEKPTDQPGARREDSEGGTIVERLFFGNRGPYPAS